MWNGVNPFPICKSYVLLSSPGGFTEQLYSGKVKYNSAKVDEAHEVSPSVSPVRGLVTDKSQASGGLLQLR